MPKIIVSIFKHFFIGLYNVLTIYLVCVFFVSRWSVQQLKIKYLSESIIKDTDNIIKEEVIKPDDNIPTPTPDNNDSDSDSDNDTETPEPEQPAQVYYPNDYWDYINVPFVSVNFTELLQKNSDTVGWIKVEGTKVNYPVVQTNDNKYYLTHSFNKRNNSGGWVYADFRADFTNFGKNTIIYAHNLTNRTMFGSLVETQKSYWYTNPNNQYIKISTPVWLIFSTYTIEPTIDYLRTNFETNSYQEFLNTMKSRSIYNFNVELTENDKILTLSTCNDAGTKRIVVQAKMVTINYR